MISNLLSATSLTTIFVDSKKGCVNLSILHKGFATALNPLNIPKKIVILRKCDMDLITFIKYSEVFDG
jgi:hypothetical protein